MSPFLTYGVRKNKLWPVFREGIHHRKKSSNWGLIKFNLYIDSGISFSFISLNVGFGNDFLIHPKCMTQKLIVDKTTGDTNAVAQAKSGEDHG